MGLLGKGFAVFFRDVDPERLPNAPIDGFKPVSIEVTLNESSEYYRENEWGEQADVQKHGRLVGGRGDNDRKGIGMDLI